MMEPNTNQEVQRRPSHIAYWIKDRENQKGEWHPVGVAWAHADGKGFNVALDLLPRDGRIALRVLEEKIAPAE
jgi:poly(3-hydroxyalkanoate) synthetase